MITRKGSVCLIGVEIFTILPENVSYERAYRLVYLTDVEFLTRLPESMSYERA
jgi:hypothetical protein